MYSVSTIKLTQMDKAVEDSWNNGKTAFFFDTTGTASRFYDYKGKLVDISKAMVQMSMGAKTLDEFKEELRKSFYFAMKNGDTLCFYSDKLIGRFNEYCDEEYLPEEIFEPEKIVNKEVYKTILREGEDVDNFGNKGWFEMREEFKVCMIVEREPDAEDNDEIEERLDSEKFDFYKIEY